MNVVQSQRTLSQTVIGLPPASPTVSPPQTGYRVVDNGLREMLRYLVDDRRHLVRAEAVVDLEKHASVVRDVDRCEEIVVARQHRSVPAARLGCNLGVCRARTEFADVDDHLGVMLVSPGHASLAVLVKEDLQRYDDHTQRSSGPVTADSALSSVRSVRRSSTSRISAGLSW